MLLQNTGTIRRENCRAILRAVLQLGVATKKDVMEQTGLSFSTCSNLMNDMAESGELLPLAQTRAGDTGRPSLAYRVNETYALVLCILIERTRQGAAIHSIIADLCGHPLQSSVQTCTDIDSRLVLGTVRSRVREYPRIALIGYSVPGIIDAGGTILKCDCTPLEGENLVRLSRQEFSLPALCENDMNLTAYGINLRGDCAEAGSVAVIADYQGIPPGAGIVVDGRIIRGSTNFAGEISYLPAVPADHEDRLVFQLACLAAVLDPALVAIVGDQCRPADLTRLQARLQAALPAGHCPALDLLENTANGTEGLIRLCLQALENGGAE